jgi:hypothetical protein
MLSDFSIEMKFVLCALAIWRLTHMIVAEDGPWDVIVKVRARLGDSQPGRAMDCFYCLSLWIAIPVTFVVASPCWGWFIFWLALSAAASLLEQATNRDINESHRSGRKERKE